MRTAGLNIVLVFKAAALRIAVHIVREHIPLRSPREQFDGLAAFEESRNAGHSYSPAYLEVHIPLILRYSTYVTSLSVSQFHRYYPKGLAHGNRVSWGLGINPDY
jgi:hypothetical protein